MAAKPRTFRWASDVQRQVYEYGPAPTCLSGGWGAGKTLVACLKLLTLLDMFPGNRVFIGRRRWEELKKTTMATFFQICPPEAYARGKRADTDKILRLNNGSEIIWGHMDDPNRETVINGLEINAFLLDQAEEIEEEIFDKLMGRLHRWRGATVPQWLIDKEQALGHDWAWRDNETGTPLPPPYALITVNPESELHWVYRRFHPASDEHTAKIVPQLNPADPHAPAVMVSYKDLGYKMFDMPSTDNKFLSSYNLSNMLTMGKEFVDRFVHGRWGISEGQIHTVSPLSLIPGDEDFVKDLLTRCDLHRTMDHGDYSPTCCLWWAVDRRSGNVFCYREYYLGNRLVSEHRSTITELSNMYAPQIGERYKHSLADPSMFFKTQQKHGGRWSYADEYCDVVNFPRQTAIFWQPADNNELGTRNRINEYLRVDPNRPHPYFKDEDGKPRLGSPRLFFIERNDQYPHGCHMAIKQTRSARREKLGMVNGRSVFSDERDENVEDHAYDPVRYEIAACPPISKAVDERVRRDSFMAVRQRALKFKRAGGFRLLAERAKMSATD